MNKLLIQKRLRRTIRSRAKIFGTPVRPRLAVHRSNTSINVQLIDDAKGHTLISASSRELKAGKKTKTETAKMVGELAAKKALEKGIKNVVFDRRGYRYHGRVRAFADGARKGGLNF